MGARRTTTFRRYRTPTRGGRTVTFILVGGLAAGGCADGSGVGTDVGTSRSAAVGTASPAADASPSRVDLADLLADGSRYDDRRITTTGTLNRIGPALAALAPAGAGTVSRTGGAATTAPGLPADPLYVVYGELRLPPDGPVTVTGVVQAPFDAAAVESALGTTLDPGVLQSLGFGPEDVVLAAESVTAGTVSR